MPAPANESVATVEFGLGEGRLGQRSAKARREVARHAHHGPGVWSIALDRDVKDDVGRDIERLEQTHANDGIDEVVEEHQTRSGRRRVASSVAEQSMPLEVTPRIVRRAISKFPGKTAPTGAEGHVVSHRDVHRATDDLERAVARVDDDESNAVGTLDRADLVDARDDDVL